MKRKSQEAMTPRKRFRFDNDLAFLSEVARRIAPLAARPNLAPEEAKAIERAAAALKKLPELTPEIDVQIEVAHRMGGEEFSESYRYLIRLDQQGVEISSSGSQYGPGVGSDSFNLESLNGTPRAKRSIRVTGTRGWSGCLMRSPVITP